MFGRLLVKGTMLMANIVVASVLLITLLATFISPNVFVIPAFATLLWPVTIVLNVFFVVFWLAARKWLFLISLLLLLLSGNQVRAVFPFNFGETGEISNSETIKVLSYNTMLFGFLKKHSADEPNEIIDYILKSDADIVCLQEFAVTVKKTGEYLSQYDIERIFKKYPYKHIQYRVSDNWKKSGIATFSKFPIVNKENLSIEHEFGMTISTDIKIKDDTVRLYNNHLESNRLTENDRKLPMELTDDFNSEKLTWITRLLSRKLFVAYKVRAGQADRLSEHMALSPYKVLVCGDFNDVPSSYTYSKIKGKLDDAYTETGFGPGYTLNLSIYRFRIDYMFYQPDCFQPDELIIDKVKYSDHYPISVNYKIIEHS